MPQKLTAATPAELKREQILTARLYLWAVKQQGRRTPAWVCEIKVEQPLTWHEDSRFFTKLNRLLKNHGIKPVIRNRRDEMLQEALRLWMGKHYHRH